MTGATKCTVGWETPDGEPMRVTGWLTPRYPGRRATLTDPGEPPEAAEFGPLTVVEDRPGGVERPELLALVEADLADLTAWAEEAAEGDGRADTREEARGER